ncbi:MULTISPECIES: DUF1294 domain-containing protein [unclassified Methanoculleus]|uniref:DUF1294 domain-containing protein n=1 Tax=unclassified Methanoculleus TaxID=2619537 RepID=UPI0025EB57D8|nr:MULTISPECIES: DUF1294 domain-containing protein [unclassified Methanoculleus]MCK9318853.1 DUF1294 domain-containing protein [Methanoculleus sp.]MDD2254876.1 DUF1294 domain-containing protein [Methanoculleus sp.]MDD2787747.1 DUF1294 domain-containing protein [Methanoculleus sp.]MDD3217315.1 DUF1294 domain-containing protein [Methanoculleus sp.]MDD4315412.1 DUF1294 domain-containing protein [Methanoculleus sp.]
MTDVLIPVSLLLIYALLNIFAFAAYRHDKKSAERAAWRTPERSLLAFALIGPFGALAAMRRFRHKTQKGKFRLVPVFVCLHLLLFAALVLGMI